MENLTYELEEIENKIQAYLRKATEHQIICKDPAEFFNEMIGKRISVIQVERALIRLEKNNSISIDSLKLKSKKKDMKIIKLIS